MNNKLVLFFVSFLFVGIYTAQQMPVLDQSFYNRYTLQPGYTGENRGLETWDGYRNNLIGLSQNPTTLALNVNYRDTEKHGFGINLLSDKTGLLSNTLLGFSYAYRLKFTNDRFLSIGLSAGLSQNRFDFNSVIVEDVSDIASVSNSGKTMFNSGFGVAYTQNRFTAGIGMPTLYDTRVTYEIRDTKYMYQLKPLVVSNAAYVFDVTKVQDLKVIPTVIVRMQQALPTLADFVVTFQYKKNYNLTAGYRTNGSFPIVAMANVYKKLKVYAGYDANVGNLALASKGGFEAGIGYKFTLLSGSEHKAEDAKLKASADSLDKVIQRLNTNLTEKNKEIAQANETVNTLKVENSQLITEKDTLIEQLKRAILKGSGKCKHEDLQLDENDVEVNTSNGYFVVVQSSKNRVALEKDLAIWQKNEASTFILKSSKSDWYHIAIEKYDTKKESVRALNRLRVKYPTSWIRIQKNEKK